MDSVQKVGNGHPGTAMSLAPMAYLLFQKWINHDPADPKWHGRDRFVLSNGHSSITLYIQLFLSGYGLELEDLQSFRTWESKTPGHPEFGHTDGVEATTGPLGTGLATAVGMAMDARYVRNLLDPKAVKGQSVFDHKIWVIAGDGCLQEGVTSEASSLAGHQNLSDLVVLYDDNHISIEGDTAVSFTEDVLARYESYDWNVSHVEMLPTGEGEIYGFKNGNLLNPQLFQKIKTEDMLTTSLLHTTADGKVLYAVDSSQRDKSALFEIDLSTQKRTLLYEDARADIGSCLVEPITKKIQAVSIDYLQKE
ncbi:MAG: hypothetical protein EBU96_05635, partial [Actinobacteria bacterium]|nr:hypothetical protein [Actinomycetota bacterium]